jgi:hypothetical protein
MADSGLSSKAAAQALVSRVKTGFQAGNRVLRWLAGEGKRFSP